MVLDINRASVFCSSPLARIRLALNVSNFSVTSDTINRIENLRNTTFVASLCTKPTDSYVTKRAEEFTLYETCT